MERNATSSCLDSIPADGLEATRSYVGSMGRKVYSFVPSLLAAFASKSGGDSRQASNLLHTQQKGWGSCRTSFC